MTPRSHSASFRSAAHVTSWPLMEDAVFTLLSVMVVIAAMIVILAPPRMSIGVRLEEAHAAGGKAIDIYGSLVDENGQPLKGATVEIYDRNGARVGIAHTDNNGFFDTKFWQDRGVYTIRVAYTSGGQTVTGSMSLDAQPGYDYGVQATLTQTDVIVFVPVPGY
jgi:hypothetical protein